MDRDLPNIAKQTSVLRVGINIQPTDTLLVAIQIAAKLCPVFSDRCPIAGEGNIIPQSEPLASIIEALVIDLRLQRLKIVLGLDQISVIRIIGAPNRLPYRVESNRFILVNTNFRRSKGALRRIKLVGRRCSL